MENRSLCDHCGGELFYNGDDQWWECADCGCAWRRDGHLIRRGADCTAPEGPGAAGYHATGIPALEDVQD